ncbi:Condensin-2 complex subunit D3, CNDD3 [Carpediemonas membranifera]|uniref:Condensin-2 complex subunit D3, CNDD3 n=1 Tax=Carpediemonas membranifera TaxID=201153 RepID=A0A8J6AXP2_9EUKA|nr:Condensin-2 complex subunit D3, CNDD3 [Carpediemonas membranifera]|eukprot:KAG9397396.1 Condensin-2 complex subunit D3, CNDD3 [Carpediemonas membranifera]
MTLNALPCAALAETPEYFWRTFGHILRGKHQRQVMPSQQLPNFTFDDDEGYDDETLYLLIADACTELKSHFIAIQTSSDTEEDEKTAVLQSIHDLNSYCKRIPPQQIDIAIPPIADLLKTFHATVSDIHTVMPHKIATEAFNSLVKAASTATEPLSGSSQRALLQTLVPLISLAGAVDAGISFSAKVLRWPAMAAEMAQSVLPLLSSPARLLLTFIQHAAVAAVDKADARAATVDAILKLLDSTASEDIIAPLAEFLNRLSASTHTAHRVTAGRLAAGVLTRLVPTDAPVEITEADTPSSKLYQCLLRLCDDTTAKASIAGLSGLGDVCSSAYLAPKAVLTADVSCLLTHTATRLSDPAPLVRRAALIATHRILTLLCPSSAEDGRVVDSGVRLAMSRSMARGSWLFFAEAAALRCLDSSTAVSKAAIVGLSGLITAVITDPLPDTPHARATVQARAAALGAMSVRYLLSLAPSTTCPEVSVHVCATDLLGAMFCGTDTANSFLQGMLGPNAVTPAILSSYVALIAARAEFTGAEAALDAVLDHDQTGETEVVSWAVLSALAHKATTRQAARIVDRAHTLVTGSPAAPATPYAISAVEALFLAPHVRLSTETLKPFVASMLGAIPAANSFALTRAALRFVGQVWTDAQFDVFEARRDMSRLLGTILGTVSTALADAADHTEHAMRGLYTLLEILLVVDKTSVACVADKIEAELVSTLQSNPTPPLRSISLGVLGAMCLSQPDRAPRHLPLFNMERQTSRSPIVRATATVALADMCLLDPGQSEPYILAITHALADPSTLVRTQAIALLGRLILSEYVKVRTPVFFHIVRALADKDDEARNLARFVMDAIIRAKDSGRMVVLVTEAAFVLTGTKAGPFNAFSASRADREALKLTSDPDRRYILRTLAGFVAEDRRRLVAAKIVVDILKPVAFEEYPFEEVGPAVKDVLLLIQDKDVIGGGGCSLEALVELAVPIVLDTYRMLKEKSPRDAKLALQVLQALEEECAGNAAEGAFKAAFAKQSKQFQAEYAGLAEDEAEAEEAPTLKTPGVRFIANRTPDMAMLATPFTVRPAAVTPSQAVLLRTPVLRE